MSAPECWLEGEEQFERFRAEVSARLRETRLTRTRFLSRVIEAIEGLPAEARTVRDWEVGTQLEACRSAAAAELLVLRTEQAEGPPSEVPLSPEPPSADNGPARAPAAARSTAAPAVRVSPTAPPVPPAYPSPIIPLLRPAEPARVPPGPGLAPQPTPLQPVAPARPVPIGPVPVAVREVAPPVPSRPQWVPREQPAVEAEVLRLSSEMGEADLTGPSGLLLLKVIACRLRRAYDDLAAVGASVSDVRTLRSILQATAREQHADQYVAPLDTNLTPEDPAYWEDLARAYEGMLPALEAYEWFAQHRHHLKQAQIQELLEPIGARQQRLFRMLERRFNARDEQQGALYRELRDCGRDCSFFLTTLNPLTPDSELEHRSQLLDRALKEVRGALEKRLAQESALEALQRLLAEPTFGGGAGDAERLQSAALACLKSGVPKTKPELRNALLDWEAFLEEAPGLDVLCQEIAKEKERLVKKGQAGIEEEEDRPGKGLSQEIELQRQALLPFTRGKRCLFIGGQNREEHRQRIREALEFTEIEWPESDDLYTSPNALAAEVRRSDIVVLLIRFMRTGMKRTSQVCKELGIPVIRFPRGLNVSRAITDFYEQLPRPEPGR
ncbi:MAG: hypothetical protein FJX77_04795 [Armatimonadetes bacterium]|nr:hypothetical protein [Armatimonadota bacterium]